MPTHFAISADTTQNHFDVISIGGGPAGLVTALGLAQAGLSVAVAAGPHKPGGTDRDRRTAALLGASIDVLRNLGVWEHCRAASAPLRAIRIVDDTGRVLKAPEVVFRAQEIGSESFGYNVPNAALVDALLAVAKGAKNLTLVETRGVAAVRPYAAYVEADLAEGGCIRGQLAVASDGRNSIARAAAGIPTRSWHYPQTAMVTWFRHSRPHNDISTEFHRPSGPFTTVPMPGDMSSLVWIESPDEAKRLGSLTDSEFRATIERQLQGLLGTLGEIGPRASFPLSALTVDSYGARRIALVGEAAHVVPPIGAQGLNLGVRDAAQLVDCVGGARRRGDDIGGPAVLDTYSAARSGDVGSRVTAIDVLNRSLLSPLLPVSLARGFGLYLLQSVGPLRRRIIEAGMMPSGKLPTLMQRRSPAAASARLDV